MVSSSKASHTHVQVLENLQQVFSSMKISCRTIAYAIEIVMLIDTSTPYSYHVLVAINHQLKPLSVSLGSHPLDDVNKQDDEESKYVRGKEGVGWNPVRALKKREELETHSTLNK